MSIKTEWKELQKIWDRQKGDVGATEGYGGAELIYNLKRNAVLQSAGTFDGDIKGYRVVNQGSGGWKLKFIDGVEVQVGSSSFLPGHVYEEHLTSITIGQNGTALLYIG